MPEVFFRGRLAVAFAVAWALGAVGGATTILLGGTPEPMADGSLVLSDHGTLTKVPLAVWWAAWIGFRLFVGSWLVCFGLLMALTASHIVRPDFESTPNRTRLVAAAVIGGFLAYLSASIAKELVR